MKLFCLSILSVFTMTDPYPDFHHQTLQEIRDNINWEIIAEARGALDNDGREDVALILQSKDPILEKRCGDCAAKNLKARIIVVLLSKGGDGKVVTQNNVFIARGDEGGITKDLKPELSVKNKQLMLSYVFLRGEATYAFEVFGDDLVLIGASKLTASHYIFRSDAVDFKKGTIITESRSERDEPVKTKTLRIHSQQKRLSELGITGTWEVAEGVFL